MTSLPLSIGWSVLPLPLSAALSLACGPPEGAADASCRSWSTPLERGVVADGDVDEASGLAGSPQHEGVLWTHNDGDDGRLFALSDAGEVLGQVEVPADSAVDWEDLSSVTLGGESWLVVGDIGDNDAERSEVAVVWVPEPADPEAVTSLPAVTRVPATLPGGPADAEALFVDPATGTPHLVTRDADEARVYALPGREDAGGPATLVATLALPGGTGGVRAADLSADGTTLVFRTTDAVLAWTVQGDGLSAALARPPCESRGPIEPDGEAIAWVDGSYFTLSEGAGSTLWQVEVQP